MNSRVIKKVACTPTATRQPIAGVASHDQVLVPDQASMPTVVCIKEGDAIRYIDVRCACGQVIRLECDYGLSST